MAEKIEHKDVKVVLKGDAGKEIPPNVEREDKLVEWASSLYENAMRIAAAGVLSREGSLEKAASVLWWAGFAVPAGYFPEDHEGDGYRIGDEEAIRFWVEGEAGRIERMIETVGFYLAATGRLLDEAHPSGSGGNGPA